MDRAILNYLYLMRNCCPYSAREITSALLHHYFCKNSHVFTLPIGLKQECPICHKEPFQLLNQKLDSAERTVRNRLSELYLRGDLQMMIRDRASEMGRAPEVYQLSDTFKTRLEDFLNRKEMKIGYQASIRLRKETEEDRQRLAAAGMVLCPSCGDRVPKSSLLRLQGAEKDCCLTEYVHAALKLTKISVIEDESYIEIVNGNPEVVGKGKTRDECRHALVESIKKWIATQQQNGLTIPLLPTAEDEL